MSALLHQLVNEALVELQNEFADEADARVARGVPAALTTGSKLVNVYVSLGKIEAYEQTNEGELLAPTLMLYIQAEQNMVDEKALYEVYWQRAYNALASIGWRMDAEGAQLAIDKLGANIYVIIATDMSQPTG